MPAVASPSALCSGTKNEANCGLDQSVAHKNRTNSKNIPGVTPTNCSVLPQVRSANFVGNGTLANGITLRALNDREFQQVQLNMRNGHIRLCELANSYEFTSVRGTAVVADLVSRWVPGELPRLWQGSDKHSKRICSN